MLKGLTRLGTLALATSALMLAAPVAAHADAPARNCQFVATSSDDVTFDGVIAGYVAHSQFDDVAIRCFIRVNSVPVASTLTVTGISAAAVAETLSFQAHDGQYVEICTEFTTSHGTQTECFETVHQEVPFAVVDGVCLVTETIGKMGFNILGLVVIEPDGDTFVAGLQVLDCVNRSVPPNAVRFSR